jgi:glucoamylase
MRRQTSGTGLVPEQAWENPALPAARFGADPATASIGFEPGRPAGSASPLTWAQAQYVRLALGLRTGRPLEQPGVVRQRYVDRGMPAAAPLALTAPDDGASIDGTSVTVRGTTAPGARIDIAAANTDLGTPSAVITARARTDGSFAVEAPVGFGTVVLTVAATDGRRTAYAQRSVVGSQTGGITVLDVADPDGDDHGPGTYAYPTSADFHDGAFDLQRFRVITDESTVYLQATTRDLTPTFGSPIGAQLLDVYVRRPDGGATSTDPAFPLRNYRIAAADAWTQRIEVQGFAAPVWVDAAGTPRAGAAVRSSRPTRTITIAVPRATFGDPGPGWTFAVVLHGQDGFSPDQARGFAAAPQPFLFGVCAPGGTSPVCAVDPGAAPKARDVITPAGVSQEAELDPTGGPVTIRGVPIR